MFLLRSGFSSDNQQLSFSSAPAQHSRENSGVVSDVETDMTRNQSVSLVRYSTLINSILNKSGGGGCGAM